MSHSNSFLESKPHYEILDGYRGIAALMVVIFHLFETYSHGHLTQIINHGYLAVDFFFVLSGFVIGYAYDNRWDKMSIFAFFKRRITRLHPMVIAGGLLGLILYYFSDCETFSIVSKTEWWKVILFFILGSLMIPSTKALDIRGWKETFTLNGPQWSLFLEYIANILYALVFRRLPKIALFVCVLIAAFFTIDLGFNLNIFGLLGKHVKFTFIGGWGIEGTHLWIGLIRLSYPFLCGLLLSRIGKFINIRGAFWWCSMLLVFIFVCPHIGRGDTLWLNGLYETLCILFIFPLIVIIGAGSKITDAKSTKICKFLGDISYPLYMTHYPLVYMQMGWAAAHKDAPISQHIMVGVSLLALAIFISYALLKLYDEPVRNYLKEHWLKKVSKKEKSDRVYSGTDIVN